jgi:hypothetical protein
MTKMDGPVLTFHCHVCKTDTKFETLIHMPYESMRRCTMCKWWRSWEMCNSYEYSRDRITWVPFDEV